MKLTMIRTALVLAALAATSALIGCSNDNDMSGMPMGHNSASSAGAPTAPVTGDFNNADVMFAQMMIPHHEQAVAMSDMLLDKRGVNPEVTALAEQIKAAQQPEIDIMNGWLRVWGRQPMDDGGMHHGGGGGMMTEDEMRQLDRTEGSAGQRLFLEGMIRHHQGAIQMAEMEVANGKNAEAINLAKQIATSQQQEIDTMTALLTKV